MADWEVWIRASSQSEHRALSKKVIIRVVLCAGAMVMTGFVVAAVEIRNVFMPRYNRY